MDIRRSGYCLFIGEMDLNDRFYEQAGQEVAALTENGLLTPVDHAAREHRREL